ncbi:MAG: alkaline phosphatase family protein [Gemmatimonadetes bacterium]|nr:alkaline phosphatase family protein [Gemmatimonadota bacterium]
MTSRDPRAPRVVVIVADGARAHTLASAVAAGHLPAIASLRDGGAMRRVTTVFPSVTGPAYTPFLMGRFPGGVGIPGIRWFDRARTATSAPHFSRSYVGHEMARVDGDLERGAPTMFELASSSLGALSVITRGLPATHRLGGSLPFALRAAWTHFRGDVQGWLKIDERIADEFATRLARERPVFAFCALTGIDKTSHASGQPSPASLGAMQVVDRLVARVRDDAERDGSWPNTHLWIVSDHGHSPVAHHDDLAMLLRGWGVRTRAHPFVAGFAHRAAVMVSGNAMAHVYLDIATRERRPWPALSPKWQWLADRLLERPSVDLLILPLGEHACEVRARKRGGARILRERGRWAYRPESGDPLGLGPLDGLSMDDAWDATIRSEYPDALVQALSLATSPRAGDIILSAARDYDFRARWEPIPHVSSHGALHREHMLVPLVLGKVPARAPRRTVDVMPSALAALGRPIPEGLDGVSFV